jgi:hypothetical protein
MVNVFYLQKTEQIFVKFELAQWFSAAMQEKNKEKALEIIKMMNNYLQFGEMRIKNGI